MKKLKVVTAVTNHHKTMRISLLLEEEVIKQIDMILLKFHPDHPYFKYYNSKKEMNDYTYQPKRLVDNAFSFFTNEEETGWIFLQTKHIQIVLLKDASLFSTVERELFTVFDFVTPPKEPKSKFNKKPNPKA